MQLVYPANDSFCHQKNRLCIDDNDQVLGTVGFARDITRRQADRELISAAISMAHGLNLIVIAEGVET
jgi:hypothetical protein